MYIVVRTEWRLTNILKPIPGNYWSYKIAIDAHKTSVFIQQAGIDSTELNRTDFGNLKSPPP